jgi:hypothetical protein
MTQRDKNATARWELLSGVIWEYLNIKELEEKQKRRRGIQTFKFILWRRDRMAILRRQYNELL